MNSSEINFDFGKKKRKPQKETVQKETPQKEVDALPVETFLDYTYDFLINRLYSYMTVIETNSLFTLPRPKLNKEGKKTRWINFNMMVTTLMRSPEHLKAYIMKEFACNASIDAENRLLLWGRFNEGHIQKIIRSYILLYVECKSCKKQNTIFEATKELGAHNLFCIRCKDCESKRYVSKKI